MKALQVFSLCLLAYTANSICMQDDFWARQQAEQERQRQLQAQHQQWLDQQSRNRRDELDRQLAEQQRLDQEAAWRKQHGK